MKSKIRSVLAVGLTTLNSWAFAAEPAAPAARPQTAAPAADSATSVVEEQSPITAELQALVKKVQAKLAKGVKTEEELSAEIKEFDTLLATHSDKKTDDVAQILLLKAMLYVQVFNDFDKGEIELKRLQKEFPETGPGKSTEEILAMLNTQREMSKPKAALQPGAVFPDFQETDTAGQPLSLAKYKGKVVLVDFWATWCGPCVAELPKVLEAYNKYHDKGFEIVGISLDKDKSALEKFAKENGMTWVQYFDGAGWEGKLVQKYGITSIPATYLLDGDGKVIAADLRGPALEAELEKRFAGK